MSAQITLSVLCLLTFPPILAADEPPDWIREGPYTDDEVIELAVPVQLFANQIHVGVEVNGARRAFCSTLARPR